MFTLLEAYRILGVVAIFLAWTWNVMKRGLYFQWDKSG